MCKERALAAKKMGKGASGHGLARSSGRGPGAVDGSGWQEDGRPMAGDGEERGRPSY